MAFIKNYCYIRLLMGHWHQ